MKRGFDQYWDQYIQLTKNPIARAVSALIAAIALYLLLRNASNALRDLSWGQFLQLTVDGLTIGALYAVIALGYTLVYGVLQLINFAHSEVFMFGAFGGLFAARWVVGGSGLPSGATSVEIVSRVGSTDLRFPGEARGSSRWAGRNAARSPRRRRRSDCMTGR